MSERRTPPATALGADAVTLAVIAARHCLMPHPDVVAACGGAVFPTIRNMKRRMRVETVNGREIMYDDNMTPRWALLWCHGMAQTGHPKGWTIAHVWPVSGDVNAYTHPANLVLMPEALASLSDKDGPLSGFLQHHACTVYGWKPAGCNGVDAPHGYDAVTWAYFDRYPEPIDFVANRLKSLNNERARILRNLMGLNRSVP